MDTTWSLNEGGSPDGGITNAVMLDPLAPDDAADDVVEVSRRKLTRLALVACATASRFALDGSSVDPMAWMFAPRRLFGGRRPVEACLERKECMQAVILHADGQHLDADPVAVDEGQPERPARAVCDVENDLVPAPRLAWSNEDFHAVPRLYTACVHAHGETELLQAFVARIAISASDLQRELTARYGDAAARTVRAGFDPGAPLAMALVSPAMADMLLQIDEDPASALAAGLDVLVEQRFAA